MLDVNLDVEFDNIKSGQNLLCMALLLANTLNKLIMVAIV